MHIVYTPKREVFAARGMLGNWGKLFVAFHFPNLPHPGNQAMHKYSTAKVQQFLVSDFHRKEQH